jgi:large subunit ribosomal protein L18
MNRSQARTEARGRVRIRIRQRIRGDKGRPRLAVFKSGRHIYAQIIDDGNGSTLAHASSLDAGLKKDSGGKGTNKDAAGKVGGLVAERAKKAGVKQVVFDRGGYRYHGRVKALAEGARAAGLEF